jgi:hypothetical protein
MSLSFSSPENPNFKEYTFKITCNVCGVSQKIPIKDINKKAAEKNAQQTFLFTHHCSQPGERTIADLTSSIPGMEEA